MVRKVALLIIACILFFVSGAVPPCQKCDVLQKACCCCQSSCHFPQPANTEHHECPCQIEQSQPEESAPAVLISYHKGTPEIILLALEARGLNVDYHLQFRSLLPDHFLLLTKDPPLYLLNQSFLC